MGRLNNRALGVAAHDMAVLRGRSVAERMAAVEAEVAELQRAFTYGFRVPVGVEIVSGSAHLFARFAPDGFIRFWSSNASISITNNPAAIGYQVDFKTAGL